MRRKTYEKHWWHDHPAGKLIRILLSVTIFPIIALWRVLYTDDEMREFEIEALQLCVLVEILLLVVILIVLHATGNDWGFIGLVCLGAWLLVNAIWTALWKMVFGFIPSF